MTGRQLSTRSGNEAKCDSKSAVASRAQAESAAVSRAQADVHTRATDLVRQGNNRGGVSGAPGGGARGKVKVGAAAGAGGDLQWTAETAGAITGDNDGGQ